MNSSKFKKVSLFALTALFFGCSRAEFSFDSNRSSLPQGEPPTVCAPFDPGNPGSTQNGLAGYIRYLESPTPRPTGVNDILSSGKDAGVQLVLNSLNAPTVRFTQGFTDPATGAPLHVPGSNTILTEWFAFDAYSELLLSDNQSEGYYQLALLSDDGAILDIDATKSAPGVTAVNNDGEHQTRMGCSNTAFYFKKNETRSIRIRYYQGPKNHIALQLLWRKVSSATSPKDSNCGLTGNDTFWNSNVIPSAPTAKYQEILSHGWSVPAPANYVLPPDVRTNPCTNVL